MPFGPQGQPFDKCIRNVLREYGGADALHTQYIANADDAGATKYIAAVEIQTTQERP